MIVLLIAITVSFLIVGFVFLFWRLASRGGHAQQSGAEWLNEFSLASYAPMERLLDPGDLVFLASQPGYRTGIGKRLMVERRRIFRQYLRNLVVDFNQLMAIGKLMVVYSAEDRPEFARTLFRQQLRFYGAVCLIRCQLALNPLGWKPVDVRELVRTLETLRNQLQELAVQRPVFGEVA
jgi:hypothetical protein